MTYERRASPLHAARAPVAAAWATALVLVALLHEHPVVLAALALCAVAGAAGAGVAGRVLGVLRFALPFALLIATVNALVAREGLTVVWRFGAIPPFGQLDVTLEAVLYGLLLGARALVILLAAALFSAAVDPDELLRVFRRVSFRSALTAALAVRLVPVLQRDARRLAEARRCRIDQPSRVAVLRAVASGALDRAADVAATLELRGYGSAARLRTARRPWSRHDRSFALSAAVVLALGAAFEVLGLAGVRPYPVFALDLGLADLAACAALAVAALLPFCDRRGIEP